MQNGGYSKDEYEQKIINKYLSYDEYTNIERDILLPFFGGLRASQKFLKEISTLKTVHRSQSVQFNFNINGCEEKYETSYKNCGQLNQKIKKIILYALMNALEFDTQLDNSPISMLKKNDKSIVEILMSYLFTIRQMLTFTSMDMYSFTTIVNYINKCVGYELIKFMCSKCDENIIYTCGRGNIFLDDQNGKYSIVVSNTVSKLDDEVKYYGIVDLKQSLVECKNKYDPTYDPTK